jgi:hypothetical protein
MLWRRLPIVARRARQGALVQGFTLCCARCLIAP